MRTGTRNMLMLAVPVVILLGGLWVLSLRYLSLEQIRTLGQSLLGAAAAAPVLTFGGIVLMQAIGMALSLPSKAAINLLAGFLLGFWPGMLATLAGVLCGTSLLFFFVRRFFENKARDSFGETANRLAARLNQRPVLTIAGLRLMVTIPYGPVTVAAALTKMRFQWFLAGSLIGDLPIVALYSLAGENLGTLTSQSEAIPPLTLGILIAAGIVMLAGSLAKFRSAEEA